VKKVPRIKADSSNSEDSFNDEDEQKLTSSVDFFAQDEPMEMVGSQEKDEPYRAPKLTENLQLRPRSTRIHKESSHGHQTDSEVCPSESRFMIPM